LEARAGVTAKVLPLTGDEWYVTYLYDVMCRVGR